MFYFILMMIMKKKLPFRNKNWRKNIFKKEVS